MLSALPEVPYMAFSELEPVHHASSMSRLPDHDFSLMAAIGNTPLVRLQRIAPDNGSQILVKLEGNNPAGSVKDRPAHSMIQHAELRGDISPGDTLIEATSGNTGIALAFICAARGYRLCLTMPETMSQERRKLLTHLGAELVLTPGSDGMKGAIQKARDIVARTPEAFMPDQFNNPANPDVHYRTTAEEIWAATAGFAGSWKSATITKPVAVPT